MTDPPTARYVCRDHLDQPVNFRGKGCPVCASALERTRDLSTDDYEGAPR